MASPDSTEKGPHPDWRENEDLIHRRGQLPPLHGFDPNDPDGWKRPPPLHIKRLAPNDMKWEKNFDFSSEFNREAPDAVIPDKQIRRWTTTNHWRGRFIDVSDPNNVSHDGNACVFKVKKFNGPSELHLDLYDNGKLMELAQNGRAFYSTSFMKSSKTISEGYFEIACKLGNSTLSSAFWLKEHGGREREIDVFEYSTSKKIKNNHVHEKCFLTNLHEGRFTYHKPWAVFFPQNLSEQQYVKAGVFWDKTFVRWYLNDVLMRELKHSGTFDGAQMHVQMDREYLPFFGEPAENDKLDDYKVFYVRSWQLKPKHSKGVAGRSIRIMPGGLGDRFQKVSKQFNVSFRNIVGAREKREDQKDDL